MNFNNTWRNYVRTPIKSKNVLLMEEGYRLVNLLAESKKKLAKGKFEITNEFGVVDILATQLKSQFGPQGMSKYIIFSCKCMEEFYQKFTIKNPEGKHVMKDGYNAMTFFDQVMGLVTDFHRNQQRIEEKDINKYTFDTLTQKLQALPQSSGEKRRHMKDKNLAKKDSELVYNENGIFAVRPLTTQSSCYYGQNPRLTNWCISTKSKLNYFKRYTEQEGKAFVITYFSGIPEGDKDHLITLEFDQDGDLTMIWDAPNKSQNPDDIYEIVERHLKGLQEKESADAIANFRDEPKAMTGAGLESKAFAIVEEIMRESKEWIQHNPPADPEQATERRCQEAERMADEEYEFVSPHWEMGNREPGEPPSVMFYANLEVLWDLDKPEYEDDTGNVLLNKDYRFWRDFESKFSENLQKMGPPWSDMSGEVNCYAEDNYAKLELRFDGYDSYHGDDAEGFEAFCAEDCKAIENRGTQMQELMAAMLDAEAGVDRNRDEDEDDDLLENKFYQGLESQLLGEEKGRSRQRGIYKFYCMIAYNLTAEGERTRGLDDILADMRALPNVTIVTVAVRNQKVAEGRYIAGLAIKFIPSTPGDMNTPENVKARIVRDIKRLVNVHSLFKLSTGLTRLE
jgi:hypothetical protein